jgi:hypothetical protein
MFLIACGIGLMIAVAESVVPSPVAVLAWGVAGLGMGISYAPLSLVVLDEAAVGSEGAATAALQLCDTLGVALGTGVAGAILAAGATLQWTIGSALTLAFVLSAAVALATSIAAVRLPATIHQHDA